jgi:hypothetical protein
MGRWVMLPVCFVAAVLGSTFSIVLYDLGVYGG